MSNKNGAGRKKKFFSSNEYAGCPENANFCSMLHHSSLGRNKDSRLWMLESIFSFKSVMWLCITYSLYFLNNKGNCQLCLRSGWLILIILNESLSVELRFTVITVWVTKAAYDAETFGHQTGQTVQITVTVQPERLAKRVVLPTNFYCGNSFCMQGFVCPSWPWQICISSWVSAVVLPPFRGDSESAPSVGVCFSVRLQL